MGITSIAGILGIGVFAFTVLIFWSLIWKGWALWIAAKKDSRLWFIIFLVVNTAGILEILYIFFISKRYKKGKLDKKVDGIIDGVKDRIKDIKGD